MTVYLFLHVMLLPSKTSDVTQLHLVQQRCYFEAYCIFQRILRYRFTDFSLLLTINFQEQYILFQTGILENKLYIIYGVTACGFDDSRDVWRSWKCTCNLVNLPKK